MEVGPALIACGQAAEACEPGQGAFHDPAVAAQPLAAVDPAPGDLGLDAALAAFPPAAPVVVALVGVQLGGSRPRLPERTGGTASRVAVSILLSCRLAPLRATPSGVPRPSTTRCRLVPGRPRSVGFGPVAAPLFWRPGWRCPGRHGSSRAARLRASRAGDASRSYRSSPARPAARADLLPIGSLMWNESPSPRWACPLLWSTGR